MTLLRKNKQSSRGSLPILIAILVMGLILLATIVTSAAMVGDRTGVGAGLGDADGVGGVDCSGIASLTPEQYQWVKEAAGKHLGGDEAALIALIQVESGWNAKAQNSTSSASGLGQFINSTARGYKEFVGGDDKHGTTWPTGQVFDDPGAHPDDARFEPKRAVYATAHLLGGMITKYGSLGDAYEKGYHGGTTPDQIQAAKAARARLEAIYQKLIAGGGCVQTGGSGLGCNNVPIFKQCDDAWGNHGYGCNGTTVCSSGCGVTSAAMILKFYGKNVTPDLLATLSLQNGFRACNAGTSHGFFPFVAQKYGLKNENGISWQRGMELLKAGKPIIVSGSGSAPFSSGGHFVVLTCLNSDGSISVNDSADGNHRKATYPASFIQSQQHFITAIYP